MPFVNPYASNSIRKAEKVEWQPPQPQAQPRQEQLQERERDEEEQSRSRKRPRPPSTTALENKSMILELEPNRHPPPPHRERSSSDFPAQPSNLLRDASHHGMTFTTTTSHDTTHNRSDGHSSSGAIRPKDFETDTSLFDDGGIDWNQLIQQVDRQVGSRKKHRQDLVGNVHHGRMKLPPGIHEEDLSSGRWATAGPHGPNLSHVSQFLQMNQIDHRDRQDEDTERNPAVMKMTRANNTACRRVEHHTATNITHEKETSETKATVDKSSSQHESSLSNQTSTASTTSAASTETRPAASTAAARKLPTILQYAPERVQPIQDKYRQELVRNAKLAQPLLNGWKLYWHQKSAILRGLLMRRAILALDMGLGKTLIACVWARAFRDTFASSSTKEPYHERNSKREQNRKREEEQQQQQGQGEGEGEGQVHVQSGPNTKLKIIFICPVSLTSEWKRTAEEATGLMLEDPNQKGRCKSNKPTKPSKTTKTAKVAKDAETNDEHLPMQDEPQNSYTVEIYSWAKVPTSVDSKIPRYVVVCDEAHSMQSMEAARTKQVLQLVRPDRCIGVLLLTGTPMKNGKPSNLFPLLRAVRHPFGDNQKDYEAHFCNGREKNIGRNRVIWDASGSSNLDLLNKHISSHLMRLTKEDCLQDLPPLERIFREVAVTSQSQLHHDRALTELVRRKSSCSITSFVCPCACVTGFGVGHN